MSGWSFGDIQRAAGGRWVGLPGEGASGFAGVSIDSRTLERGQIFFAFVGEHVDGHDYIEQAQRAGACMCVLNDASRVPESAAIPMLVVEHPIEALTALARAWREQLDAKVIAVTGSNGKTTTCRFIYSICAQSGKSSVSQKSFNNELGVAITILNTPDDAEYLIAELGTSSPGEIAQRVALVKPSIAVITSIGRAHLEDLGDRDGVAREKSSIIKGLADDGAAMIIGGDRDLENAIRSLGVHARIVRVGCDNRGDYNMVVTDQSTEQTSFAIDMRGVFTIPMLGVHNASNASLALAVGRELGISDEQIRRGLAGALTPAMRFERVEISTRTRPICVYNDAYNANPDSMVASLTTFDSLDTKSNKIAVLGEMLELGERSGSEHQRMVDGLEAFPSVLRFVLVGSRFASTDTNPDWMVRIESTDTDAIGQIARSIKPGSYVLLKGSRGVGLERVIDALRDLHADDSVLTPEARGGA